MYVCLFIFLYLYYHYVYTYLYLYLYYWILTLACLATANPGDPMGSTFEGSCWPQWAALDTHDLLTTSQSMKESIHCRVAVLLVLRLLLQVIKLFG